MKMSVVANIALDIIAASTDKAILARMVPSFRHV